MNDQGIVARDIGRVTKIGDSLSREVHGVWVEHADGTDDTYGCS